MKKGVLIFWLALILIIVVGVGMSFLANRGSGKYDQFTTCLKDKGVIFYGAYWCPHCQATKRLFGKSASLLPYVECSTPDGQNQTQICKDKHIEAYPTWTFPNSTTTLTGEHTLQELSGASGCQLPQ